MKTLFQHEYHLSVHIIPTTQKKYKTKMQPWKGILVSIKNYTIVHFMHLDSKVSGTELSFPFGMPARIWPEL